MNMISAQKSTEHAAFTTEDSTHYEGRDLEAMSFAKNYYQWLEGFFAPYFRGRGIEVGAGSGNFTEMLLVHDFTSLVALEPSETMFALLKERFSGNPKVTARNSTLSKICTEFSASFDTVVYINVLEHIENDGEEMAYANQILKKGGHLCIFVPALPWLYSSFDKSVGHYRRYYKRDVERLLESKGFEIVQSSYFDIAGILPWLIFFTLGGLTLSGGKTKAYDRYIVPIMSRIEAYLPIPMGKNIIVVAQKR